MMESIKLFEINATSDSIRSWMDRLTGLYFFCPEMRPLIGPILGHIDIEKITPNQGWRLVIYADRFDHDDADCGRKQ